MVHLGVKNGELAVFDADGRPASLLPAQACKKSIHVLRGGLRAELQPLGLTLLQRAGARSGDAFILVLDNDRTSVACILAAMNLQCLCPLISKSHITLLEHIKTHTGITRVLTVDDTTESVIVGNDANLAENTTDEAAANLWTRDKEFVDKGCVCLLTSGSVGKPKIVSCTWDRMLLQGESTHQQLFPKSPARIICSTSISHAFAINTIFALYTSPCDAQSELCFASSAVGIYTLLAQRTGRFTVLYATPGTYTKLATMQPTPLYADVSYCAGARLCLPLFRKMHDDYGMLLMQNYGSTETGNIAAWNLYGKAFEEKMEITEGNENLLYVGSAWPGVKLHITEYGELTIKTPWQSVGYIVKGMLHRLSEVYHSSDIGTIKRDQGKADCVWLQGRLRLPVEVDWQGQRMTYSPKEIENVLLAHPHVTDALVLMQDDTTRKQGIIHARVVPDYSYNVGALNLKQWCINHDLLALRDTLFIELVKFLPCSPAGKLIYT